MSILRGMCGWLIFIIFAVCLGYFISTTIDLIQSKIRLNHSKAEFFEHSIYYKHIVTPHKYLGE